MADHVVPGTLYMVGIPIGNERDITLRARDILAEVDLIACEDTRVSGRLLKALEIQKPMVSCRSQNEEASARELCTKLLAGASVAYVSDAGSPGISDPGGVFVALAREAEIPVLPIPGASALATLVSVSNGVGKGIAFMGFLPRKSGKLVSEVMAQLDTGLSVLFYESPHRIIKSLEALRDAGLASRQILLGREMTKAYEEYITGTIDEVLIKLSIKKDILGEFSVLIYGETKKREHKNKYAKDA